MERKLKLTVIGAGNIGGATARGLSRFADVTVTARTEETLSRFEGSGIRTCLDNLQAVQGADFVIFAVKPWMMEEVVKSVAPALDIARQTIVSMAPGIRPEDFLKWLGPDVKLAYAIPNTAIEVGESMTFIASVTAPKAETARLVGLFACAGKALEVEMDELLSGTSLASCGIAYALRYIQASATGGEDMGFSPSQAVDIVSQTVKGAAAVLEAHGSDPQKEIDKVTTPGGLTLKGLAAMDQAGFANAVVRGLKANTAPKKRLVVKIGSNVLTRQDGTIDVTRVSSLVDQIVRVKSMGYDVIIVTSGAVACGCSILGPEAELGSVEQRQVYAAVGQVRLMDLYNTLFGNYSLHVGQVLTVKDNFASERAYSNQKSCMEAMLKSGLIPVVNENDTVSITELMFTDNDELSGLVATMMEAETLIILSNIDGIFDADPSDPEAKVIRLVRPQDSLESFILPSKSSHGRGGMESKYRIARETAAQGVRVMIANGKTENILPALLDRGADVVCTEFEPSKQE